MSETQMFNTTVNFRCLASQLRKDGHTAVPDYAGIMEAARKTNMPELQRWAEVQYAQNSGAFFSTLAFHLGDVGDAS